jgi:hypothetical protein
MEDTLAVLLDAIGAPMATPSPAVVAADEFAAFMGSEESLDSQPAPSRLSFQPRDIIQTPGSATGSPPAAAGGAAPNVALPPAASPLPMPDRISMQAEIDRMAIQAGLQAATMQVQAAELKAQAADLKYQALAMQMKEAAHTADMRELTLQMQLRDAHAETALAIERAEHAAALAVMTRTATVPPGPIMVTASYEREKFIGRQLVPFTTAAYIEANRIRPGTSAETISEVALTLLSALTAVHGREQYAVMVGALLNLSLQLDASSAGSVAQVTVRSITAMLAGETDGASEMDEDSLSTIGSSSSASDSPPPPRRDIFDGKGADKRRKAFHALQAVLCGVGDVVHPCMVHWAAIDRSLLTILKSLVPATHGGQTPPPYREPGYRGA